MGEYRNIDINAWTQVGEGGNGTTYENPSEFNRLAGQFACLDLVVRYELQKPSLLESLFFASYIRSHIKNYYL